MSMSVGDVSSKFVYSKAVVCGVPASLPENAQRMVESGDPVDLTKARRQHKAYVAALKQLGLDVIELPADEAHPDCVFVEDTAVVCDTTALIPRLGHPSRRGETERMKRTLEGFGLTTVVMEEPGLLDGGDVLFTGREFLVGLSTRTNQAGVEAMRKAFPAYSVVGINVKKQLHLKTVMTMAGPDLFLVSEAEEGRSAWDEVQLKAKFKYQKIEVPECKAANCLFINGCLVHLHDCEIPASAPVLKKIEGRKIALENSECSKVDGCLTCLSVLIN